MSEINNMLAGVAQGQGLSSVPRAAPGTPKAGIADQAPERTESRPVAPDELGAAVSQISERVQNVRRNLNFRIDEITGYTVVKVIDANSDEIIRQIPPEEMLELARSLQTMTEEQATGLLLRSKA